MIKTKLVVKTEYEPRVNVGKFIRVWCDCGAIYEHPLPGQNQGFDLPCPRCHPNEFLESSGMEFINGTGEEDA
jgi:hypothetical protein